MTMTDCRKIFFDTAPLIYLLDKDATWGQVMRETVTHFIENDITMVSSVVTCMEYLVHPYRDGNQENLQLSISCIENCDVFLTNDKRLCQCKEAHCILIDDFVK